MAYNLNLAEEKMKKSLEHTTEELATIRTGRASQSILNNIKVEYYGSEVPITQVANIMVPQSRLIEVKPWDKSTLPNIEKAILKSDIGLTPVSDGKLIRINVPPLTEERRKELVKIARRIAEDGKVSLRNIRRTTNEEVENLKTKGELSEDEMKKFKDKIQKILDNYINQLSKILADKEKDIMEV